VSEISTQVLSARPLSQLFCVCVFAVLVPVVEVGAAVVPDLYEAQVGVASKDPAQRKAAFVQALVEVATKVSGVRQPQAYSTFAEASRRAGDYVQQFRYERDPADPEEPGLVLWVSFDSEAVDGLLRRAGLPVWGRTRPSVIVWLAVQSGRGRRLLGADEEIADTLRVTAARRGVDLVLPLLDLEDQSRLTTTDVWGGFNENVARASRRYQSETVLVGRAYQIVPEVWESGWELLSQGSSHSWTMRGGDLQQVLEEGIGETADVLARRFASAAVPLDAGPVVLAVRGVRTLEDYARTLSYLRELAPVDEVYVSSVEADRVSFAVTASGGRPALEQVIALGRTLSRIGAAYALEFELQP
jgi:hypothetical protein